LTEYLPHITVFAVLDALVIVLVIPWVLMTKREATTAIAWCLLVFFLPLFGGLFFWVFGYNTLYRPLRRKRRHRSRFQKGHPPTTPAAERGGGDEPAGGDATWNQLGQLASRVRAFPVSHGNAVTFYDDTHPAYDALLTAVEAARHHINLEYFIFRPDETGRRLLEVLTAKAKAGVQVRLLYDSVGTRNLGRRALQPLRDAGGKVAAFLPINPIRSRLRINLRNHRKIVVVDGAVGFTGGMNIGDEYLGKSPRFGYWRDQVLRLEGPGVAGLQRIFMEDWDFAAGETLDAPDYFPARSKVGDAVVQVVESGPDQELNSIREILFAAILSARERLWMASPYFVPDTGLLDAIRLASYRGVDVRLLCLLHPDKWIAFYAAHYYWSDLMRVGMKIYQYAKGMMHSKIMLVDGQWGLVGSANLDNRSLHLNFEAGCILHTPALVSELEASFLRDLENSVSLDAQKFAARPFAQRLATNTCRLLSPIL
jgi:cardiolipin synthase